MLGRMLDDSPSGVNRLSKANRGLKKESQVTHSPQILDGKKTADELKAGLKNDAASFKGKYKRAPGLVVILVGSDPASQIYVNNKIKTCAELGFHSQLIPLSADVGHEALVAEIQKLNADQNVDGILVQLPLPKHLSPYAIADAIYPDKDVDALCAINQGLLFRAQAPIAACTPSGVIHLLKKHNISIEGKSAVVLGRSEIVGKPMVHLLNQENASVTWLHSKSENIDHFLKSADIVVAAVGKPKLFKMSQFKKGVVLIDVGIHRTESGICGDIDFHGVEQTAAAYTPVPGGVGPLTIAMLLQNTLRLAQIRQLL